MPACRLPDIDIHNHRSRDLCRCEVPPFLPRRRSEYLARGGEREVIAGGWNPPRLVRPGFAHRKSNHNQFSDPDYRRPKAVRQAAGSGNPVAVDGLSG